jgi:membrane associated rhomboid family serine protease
MGIHDREYYRREGPSFLDSFHLRGRVCKWLIGLNLVIWVAQLLTRTALQPGFPFLLPGPVTDALILNTQKVLDGQVWRLLTYAFLHDPGIGFAPGQFYFHILFNMLFLWWFGSDMEEMYGPREFLAFYLTAAFLGGVAYTIIGALTNHQNCLGASGAVTAVMVLCALHFPNRTILLFFVLPVPLWLFVGFQVVQDTFLFVNQTMEQIHQVLRIEPLKTRVAVSVHLAGAAFAFAYYKLQWRLTGFLSRFSAWKAHRSRPRLRVYREEERRPSEAITAAVPPPLSRDVDEQLEAKLDAVLEKVARSGQASLTESERQILLRASEVYKRRRS